MLYSVLVCDLTKGEIMMLLKVSLIVLAVAGSNSAFAKSNAIEKRAGNFLLGTQDSRENICQPPYSGACVEFVAGSMPTTSERQDAVRACIGNYGVECAAFVAGSMPSFNERVNAARSCKNNVNLDCVQFVTEPMSFMSDRITAANACQNADVNCVKYAAGSRPTFFDRVSAANACGGN